MLPGQPPDYSSQTFLSVFLQSGYLKYLSHAIMPLLTQKKATQLMLRTCDPPPYMRVADTLLDLDEEAKPTADAMYTILKDDYKWNWPVAAKHLAAWQDDRDESERIRDPKEETEEEYQERLKVWIAWPRKNNNTQFQWLRCAIITSNAFDYLHQCYDQELALRGISEQGDKYNFRPKAFYEYIWICLNQGFGTRQWKSHPPKSQASGALLAKAAQDLVANAVRRWEQGEDLGAQYPVMTLGDLLPSPYVIEAISVVRTKRKKYLAQQDEVRPKGLR